MGEFDYSRDIAPLRGNFFSNPRLTDREREGLRGRFVTEIAPLMEVHDKLNDAARDKQRDDLSYQRGIFELRQAKRSAREERDALTKIPEITAALDAAWGDPKATTITRAKALADTSAKFAPHIAKNPALAQVLSAYSGRLQMEDVEDARIRDKREAKKLAEDRYKFERAARQAEAKVPIEDVQKIFGDIDPREQEFLDDMKTGRAAADAYAQKERDKAAGEAAATELRRRREAQETEFNDYLNKLEQAKLGDEDGAVSGDYDVEKDGPRPFTLRGEDRRRIIAALKGIHRLDPKDIPTDDEELFDLALEKKYSLPTTTANATADRHK